MSNPDQSAAKPRVVTTRMGVDPERLKQRKPRGRLIEPIYLCVGIAVAIFGGEYPLILDGDLRVVYVAQGIGCGLLLAALVQLLVEMRRGR